MNAEQIMDLVDEEVGNRPEAILEFLEALSESSYATGRHLEEAWQDRVSARRWDKIGDLMWKVKENVSKLLPF